MAGVRVGAGVDGTGGNTAGVAGVGGGRVAAGAAAELLGLAGRVSAAMEAAVNAQAALHGLNRADVDVLVALVRSGPGRRLKPTDLMELCALSSGGTTKVVRRMTESGYVVREADLYDGRSSWVQLTEEGLGLVAGIEAEVAAQHTRLLERLPAGVVDALIALLEQAAVVLEREE